MNIEDLQRFCTALSGTTESVKWEDHLCFCIGEKMYAITSLSGRPTLSLKVTDEDFVRLTEGDHFIPAPYLARYKWVATEDFTAIADDRLKGLLQQSYALIKQKLPKSVLNKIEG